jgi:hypothetical protein
MYLHLMPNLLDFLPDLGALYALRCVPSFKLALHKQAFKNHSLNVSLLDYIVTFNMTFVATKR